MKRKRTKTEDIEGIKYEIGKVVELFGIREYFRGFRDANGNWIEFQDCGDGNTFVSKDILFLSEFNKDWNKADANVFEGSDVQTALNKWFDEDVPEDIKAKFDVDLLAMTEIFGETQENGHNKFWHDEPYEQLPLFKDWRNRIKGETDGNYPISWWTKSPSSTFERSVACFVTSHGCSYTASVYHNIGVVPCLRWKAK